jgi:tRNA (guanine-N7-)-methyltransferase
VPRRRDGPIPGPDRRVAFSDVLEKGWDAIFAPDVPAPVRPVVELGFGRGEFLLWLAGASPATPFVGIERSPRRTWKLARRLARLEVANVRLLCEPAERAVPELFAPGSVRAFWVNFSDPWPKKRHHKRRLLQPAFVHDLATRLVPGGELQVATDDPSYAEWIDAVLAGEGGLENALGPAPHVREMPGRPATVYEQEWRGKGRIPYFWTYRRHPAPPPGPEP